MVSLDVEINPRFNRGMIKERSDPLPPLVRGGGFLPQAKRRRGSFVISPSVLANARTAPSEVGSRTGYYVHNPFTGSSASDAIIKFRGPF